MDYLLLKAVHLSSVALSIAGFALRGVAALATVAFIVSVAISKQPMGWLAPATA